MDTSRCRLPCWERTNRWETPPRRWEAGRETHELFQRLARQAGAPQPPRRIMEWGVGRVDNASHFAHEAEQYYGVELDRADLERCHQQLNAGGFSGFVPVSVRRNSPEEALLHLEQPVDLFLSTGAFQQLPDPEHCATVLTVARMALAPGGLALVQARYHDGSEYLPLANSASFRLPRAPCSFRIETFRQMTVAAGFTVLHVLVNPPSRSAFYLLKRESC